MPSGAWRACVSEDFDAGHDPAVVVPPQRLSADVMRRLVEEVVTRDGTDYGAVERTLEEKIRDVTRQLHRGEVVIVYDHSSGTTNIVPKPDAGSPIGPKE
jgi:uncharacterized protein YheU (UPF0270 family)